LQLNLLQYALRVFSEALPEHEAAQAVIMRQDHNAFDQLLHAPPRACFISLQHPLQMIHGESPGPESHDLVQLAEAGQSGVDPAQAFSNPVQIAAFKHELLLEDVK